jgi:hypothetical protein
MGCATEHYSYNQNGGYAFMTIGGVSIILIGGIINMALILFQLLSGLHYIKVPFGVHKKTGILLVFCAVIHGILGFLAQS